MPTALASWQALSRLPSLLREQWITSEKKPAEAGLPKVKQRNRLTGFDLAVHRREFCEQLVLRVERDVAFIHRDLQVFDQRVEIAAVDVQMRVHGLHVAAGVSAGAAEDHAELFDQMFLDAFLVD